MSSDPSRPPPRPVAPPGKVSTPDQLRTVEPGEWPAQLPNAVHPAPVAASAPPPPPPPGATPPVATPRVAPSPLQVAPPPPPYPVARRSLAVVWLTLAAAVVLLAGVAGTVTLIRPWDDDERVAAGDVTGPAESDEPEVDAAEPPAPSPTESASPPAAPPAPVTADLDGDGYGDAALVVDDDGDLSRVDLTSTGRAFTASRGPLSTYEDRTWADFDRDGSLDRVSWSFEFGGTLALTSEDLDFGEAALRLSLDERFPFVTLRTGDADGDGRVDLIAYGATAADEVTIWMIRNDGSGFAQPVEWARLPGSSYGRTTVLVGDYSGDGRADAVVRQPAPRGRDRGELGYRMLASTGSDFAVGPFQQVARGLAAGYPVTGAFGRDGAPLILVLGQTRDGLGVQALRSVRGMLVVDRRWRTAVRGPDADLVGATVSDVDGDGLDDVVFTTVAGDRSNYGAVRVLRSTGNGLAAAEEWAAGARCRPRTCVVYFQNGY